MERSKLAIVYNLNIQTDMPMQIVLTQIRLLMKEQSDLGCHYLPFHSYSLHLSSGSEIDLLES